MLLDRFPEVQSLEAKDKWRLIDELWCDLARQVESEVPNANQYSWSFSKSAFRIIRSTLLKGNRRPTFLHEWGTQAPVQVIFLRDSHRTFSATRLIDGVLGLLVRGLALMVKITTRCDTAHHQPRLFSLRAFGVPDPNLFVSRLSLIVFAP
jgi:hypothetical protein